MTVQTPMKSLAQIRRGFGILGMILLTACASSIPDSEPAEKIALAPGLPFQLPETPDLGRRVEAAQFVTVRHGGRVFVFEGRLSNTGDRFRMAGLDPLGRRALTVDWTGKHMEFDAAPWLPEDLRAGNLLADMVLIYWPTRVISPMLEKSGAVLKSGSSHRAIFKDGEEVIRIEYTPSLEGAWNGYAKYQNFVWGYVIEIRSTEISP